MALVALRNVSKIYHLGGEEIRALDDLSLDIQEGEFISNTGHLDSHTGEVILELFRALSQEGRTIALVTHDPEIAASTPHRIEIRDGRIARKVDRKLTGLDELTGMSRDDSQL